MTAAAAVGAGFWLIPVLLLVDGGETAPTVHLESVTSPEQVRPPEDFVARLQPERPPVPSVRPPMPVPAAVLPELAEVEIEPRPEEPYDPTEQLEEAQVPFPTAEPEVVQEKPKAKSPRQRPVSQPKPAPRPAVTGVTSPARVLRSFKPHYPRSARKAGTEGRVVLTVQIRPDGRVGSVRVATSSGSAALDSAAISAVKRWSFAPEMKNGREVSATLNVPFRFELE